MLLRPAILLLLLLPVDDAAEARFKRLRADLERVKKSALWTEVKERRDLIEALGDLDHPGVEKVLYSIFAEDREQLCRIPAMVGLGKRGSFAAQKAMVTAAIRDSNELFRMCLPLALAGSSDPEIGPWLVKHILPMNQDRLLRAAVIESLGHLRTSEAYEPIRRILAKGGGTRIAYESLIALARIGGARSIGALLPFLDHDDPVLREGAVTALAESRHPGAIEVIPKMAADTDVRVREAVAGLVLALEVDDGIPAVIDFIRSGRLRLMETSRQVLKELSGEDHGHDPDAWERWYGRKRTGKLPPKGWKASGSTVATYYGMRVFSDRVIFVIDVSNSMKATVSGRKTDDDPQRIDVAKAELTKTLDRLDERTLMNIVGFSGSPVWWRDSEVRATKRHVVAAKAFVEGLSVGGGTNVYDTFEQALEKNRHVDTIFFLGDGSPSLGQYTEQEEIRARLRWMNRMRKIKIHTIALLRGEIPMAGAVAARYHDEDEAARFLARLAADHGGGFVKIDK